MKKIIVFTAIAIGLAFSTQAAAHGAKPKHGGIVHSANDLSFELVSKDGKAVIHVEDHGKELSTAGATGTLTVLARGKKSRVALEPAGTNTLVSKTDVKLERGDKAVASITFAGKEPMSVRFSKK